MKKLFIFLVIFSGYAYSQDYAKGKQLFNQHCAACHKMDRKLVGPPLQDVIELQGIDWTKKWIYNSKALIDAGDPHAVEIWEEYNKAAMPSYQFLKDEELNDIIEYLGQWKKKKAEATTTVAAPTTNQVVVNNTPTPISLYILLGICMFIATIAIYAFYVGLKAISDVTAKTQSTNLYLMKKLHLDQDKVDGEINNLIDTKVKKKVDKKLKEFKKDLNKRLKGLK